MQEFLVLLFSFKSELKSIKVIILIAFFMFSSGFYQ